MSVHSQADTEAAELTRERYELQHDPEGEERELATIYQNRGLSPQLSLQVARELMANDAVSAHMRDELGMSEHFAARPLQAALASAASFIAGASVPIVTTLISPLKVLSIVIALASLCCLAVLGALAARLGGAPVAKGAGRVVLWGALAMATTFGVGALFGVNV